MRGRQKRASLTRYKIVDSFFAANKKLAGTGTGARVEFADTDSSFLEMVGTKLSDEPVAFEQDETKRTDLHVVPGTPGAELGAGMFTKAER